MTAQNDNIKKLYLANERVGILVAGAGDLGSTVVGGFLDSTEISSLGITELTMALHHYARDKFKEWFELFAIKQAPGDSRPTRPDLNFIVAGYTLDDQPRIYRMSSSLDFAPMLHNYGFGIDGIAQYALYLVNRLYDRASSIEDLQCLAAYLISETASQDGKVGGAIQMATITKQVTHLLAPDAVDEIMRANRTRSLALKKSFQMTVEASGPLAPVALPLASSKGDTGRLEEFSTISDSSTRVIDELTEDAVKGIQW